MSNSELELEKRYLSKVQKIIKELIDKNNKDVKQSMDEATEFKKFIWEERRLMTARELLIERSRASFMADLVGKEIKNLNAYKKALKNSYFSRVDFLEKNHKKAKPLYIGLKGIAKNQHYYVYDWRAPISSIYYNYNVGPAQYDTPDGEISGDIILKKQFKIENGKLIRAFTNDMNIDDDVLQEVLSKNSSLQMRNIVNTIQSEQNAIIRNTHDPHLIVQGVAGSGKTSVALHRIAYLLYQERDLHSNNVLIFSPNNVFSNYIANVLPELGEENVLNTTFSDLAQAYVPDCFDVESFTEFIDRIYKDDIKCDHIKHVFSNQHRKSLDQFIKNYLEKIAFKKGVMIADYAFFEKDELNELFNVRYKKLPLLERVTRLAEQLHRRKHLFKLVSIKQIGNQLFKELGVERNIIKLYRQYLESIGEKTNIKITKGAIPYHEIMAILYLKFELQDYPYEQHIKHVIIDEVQDYAPLQIYLLRKIFPKASFTLLGDINQTINPFMEQSSLELFTEYFKDSKYIELLKTYRSSPEIIEFSNNILGLENVCTIRRFDDNPVIIKSESEDLKNDLIQDIEALTKKNNKRIALITKTLEEAQYIYNLLKDDIKDIDLIDNNIISGNIVVVPSYLSKGLEFDAVIAYVRPGNKYTKIKAKLYYVVCTRAQHNLIVYNQ